MGCNNSSQKDAVSEVVLPSGVRSASDRSLKNVVPSEDSAVAASKEDCASNKSTHDGGSQISNDFGSPLATPTFRNDEEKPVWSKKVLSSGADKDIFAGFFRGRPVAVCVAKPRGSGWTRIQNEISVFQRLGHHPHIVEMYYSGMVRGSLYLALEIVEPIGYDLDRLKNMYSFASQTVPSSLMARIFNQLISALRHMHKKGIIHRDLKTENILVNERHEAKVIDMGIACKVGTRDTLRAGYLAPELCEGRSPLTVKVDSWGLGIILHQVYQNQWKVLTDSGPVKMLEGKPSDLRPMEKPVRDAMCGLLQLSHSRRWSLQQLMECEWLDCPETPEASKDWRLPAFGEDTERRYLRRYVSKGPLPTALAVFITRRNHEHIIGQPINSLGLSTGLGITVMMISYGKGRFEVPTGDHKIKENSWLYLGVPQDQGLMQQAVEGLERILSPDRVLSPGSARSMASGTRSTTSGNFRALNKQEVVETGKLVEFTVEFDCFTFPQHIGAEAVIGDLRRKSVESASICPETPMRALHLRRAFNVNLVGIHSLGAAEPSWFPRANAVVRPDDLGLIVRLPCMDGSTEPTLTDEHLQGFMDESMFNRHLLSTSQRPPSNPRGTAKAATIDEALPGLPCQAERSVELSRNTFRGRRVSTGCLDHDGHGGRGRLTA